MVITYEILANVVYILHLCFSGGNLKLLIRTKQYQQ